MVHAFADFELDPAAFELRRHGQRIAVEPQVLRLILLLVENADRLVTRDEIIDRVWHGRIVSDAALSSRIKSARQALGDSGASQHMIRTIHGRGFRFVGSLGRKMAVIDEDEEIVAQPQETQRPSIAVLPFAVAEPAGPFAGWAEALPHDLIAELSRLRWLFVIARGSSFRFSSATADVRDVGARLSVRYCLTGNVEQTAGRAAVLIELADTRDAGVVWSERYEAGVGQVPKVRASMVADVLSALEVRIPAHEATKGRLQDPAHLSAWGAYHLGLQHMFLFNRRDNQRALELFTRATEIDPGFARAHGGLSFGHFQNAFLQYGSNRAQDADNALRCAEQALLLDSLDPFANLNMGRAHWLRGEVSASLGWLDRAVQLNPNYSQALYSRAWSEMILGQSDQSQRDVDAALSRSPLDPMRYAMAATRALSHVQLGQYSLAAGWAESAARAPGAHHLIGLIAVACHHLNGDLPAAARWAASTRLRTPGLTQDNFFRSFPFTNSTVRAQIAGALQAEGF